jgi:alginate O-acetyltransferase complex protein AlgI
MIFNSFEYLIFLPTVLIIYYSIPFQLKWLFLLISSYYFYMSWNPYFIVLILTSTLIDYFCSLKMSQTSNRRPYLYLSIATNLSILFIFKYLSFATLSLNALLNTHLPMFNLLLPMGISFYTFQSMSYTIDVYNQKISSEKHFGTFALFISFSPNLLRDQLSDLPIFYRN